MGAKPCCTVVVLFFGFLLAADAVDIVAVSFVLLVVVLASCSVLEGVRIVLLVFVLG